MMVKPILKKIYRKLLQSKPDKKILSERLSKHLQLGYQYEDAAFAAMQVIKHNTMLPYEQLLSLYEQVAYCEKNNIPGCFIECGVWKAGASGMMALANLQHSNERRQLYLFDAFDDICEPDTRYDSPDIIEEVNKAVKRASVPTYTGELKPISGIYDVWGGHGTLGEAKQLLQEKIQYPENYITYVKGWFQDTVHEWAAKTGPIAILRLDGDWYESTKVCLEAFYPQLVKGGICIIDDYGYNTGCQKAVDEYLAANNQYPLLNKIEVLRHWIKQ
jgi:O-methyltransferase